MNCPQDSQIFRLYNHECVKMCPGLRDCHETPDDMWHRGKCYCVTCGHNQVPLSPPRPQVARQNILWEQGSLERGDLTVGVLIKLNSIYLIPNQGNLEQGNLIKKKLSFLFVPTWDHHVFVDFYRLSTVKVRELHDEKIHSYNFNSVRDEK